MAQGLITVFKKEKEIYASAEEVKKSKDVSYLPHRQCRLPVSLCPGRFLTGRALELHYPVSRSGPEDMAEL